MGIRFDTTAEENRGEEERARRSPIITVRTYLYQHLAQFNKIVAQHKSYTTKSFIPIIILRKFTALYNLEALVDTSYTYIASKIVTVSLN